jgi:hypothetical protein
MISSSSLKSIDNKKENNSSESIKFDNVNFQSFYYYHKPSLGTISSGRNGKPDNGPVQIISSLGSVGIGIPNKQPNLNGAFDASQDETNTVICSGPEDSNEDIDHLRSIIFAFLFLAAVNILITSLLYGYADIVDTSQVEYKVITDNVLLSTFDEISESRREIEVTNFIIVISTIIFGSISCITQNTLGLSIYCMAVCLNFILSVGSLPYFVYSFRYFFDIVMLYFALILRAKLSYFFLPVINYSRY